MIGAGGEDADQHDDDGEKRQTQQTKQRHRNDVRANLKGERSQKVKNMAVTVKDLSIKTWWRSLVTYR